MTSYDEIPYDSQPFPQSHPDRLATTASLFGLSPPALDGARVLELGCAGGGNLIPVAAAFPQSRCVGIDLSPRQVADGQKVVDALGLKNIELRAQSILDFDDAGPFDYVVCHGVYSWVPPEVQQRILAICGERLSPQGIAYVSYNTYPGWYLRSGIRQMMLYHTRTIKEPKARVRQSRALLQFLSRSAKAPDKSPYTAMLNSELAVVQEAKDHYLLHEHLEDFNEPVFFYQFVERAAAHRLRYLGEADIAVMRPVDFDKDVRETLQRVSSDRIQLEQYLDFLRNRLFRQTLLCRAELEPRYQPDPSALERFHLLSRGTAPPGASPRGDAPLEIKGLAKSVATLRNPMVKAAFLALIDAYPRALPFAEVAAQAQQRLAPESNTPSPEARQQLAGALLHIYGSSMGLLSLHLHPPAIVNRVGERPVATPLSRYLAAKGGPVTSAYHENVVFGPAAVHLLPYLDGTRDRAALEDVLAAAFESGALKLEEGAPAEAHAAAKARLDGVLQRLCRGAVLAA